MPSLQDVRFYIMNAVENPIRGLAPGELQQQRAEIKYTQSDILLLVSGVCLETGYHSFRCIEVGKESAYTISTQ